MATIRFLEAYANTGYGELESLLREAGASTGVERRAALSEDPAFSVAADTATALREAAQWMMYLNAERARTLMTRAGDLFRELRQPFGLYLNAVSGREQDSLFDDASEALRSLQPDGDREPAWPALRQPQQQAYLVLALAGSPAMNDRLEGRLSAMITNSVHNDGVVPVGALGTPIRRFWRIAAHLVERSDGAARAIAQHLAAMCEHYAESMASAQVNQELWRHGAAPVDVADIDIAGMAALTAREFSADALLGGLAEAGLSPERSSIALAPIEAGLALAEPWRDEPVEDL